MTTDRPETGPPGGDESVDAGRDNERAPLNRRQTFVARVRELIHSIREGDEAMINQAVIDLSQRRRYLAPLGLLIGAFAMLFEGLRLVVTNWRLLLIEVLPAMWIWAAMLDLKIHALHGHSFRVIRGPILIPLIAVVALITAASFFLNAVFAFAISQPGPPQIRSGFAKARQNVWTVLTWGFLIGVGLGVATLVFPRWGRWWFTISLSIVVGVLMLTYVAIPSRLIGMKSSYSARDQFSATLIGSTVGAIVCTPAYMLGRMGLLWVGSKHLLVLGVIALSIGFALQAGGTGAVKAVTVSAKLVAGRSVDGASPTKPT